MKQSEPIRIGFFSLFCFYLLFVSLVLANNVADVTHNDDKNLMNGGVKGGKFGGRVGFGGGFGSGNGGVEFGGSVREHLAKVKGWAMALAKTEVFEVDLVVVGEVIDSNVKICV
nr:hypothetical protein [Tanacetum cinerariifolium]